MSWFFNFYWWITESQPDLTVKPPNLSFSTEYNKVCGVLPYKTDVCMCLFVYRLSYHSLLAAALLVIRLASSGDRASLWLLISWRAASVRRLLLSLRWLSTVVVDLWCVSFTLLRNSGSRSNCLEFKRFDPPHVQVQMCCLTVSRPLMVAPISPTCPSENNAIVIHLLGRKKSSGSGWGVGESQPVWTKKGTSFISMWSDLPKSTV